MSQLKITYVDGGELQENPWNPNHVSPTNMDKLRSSMSELDTFRPVICREIDGGIQILGGKHRVQVLTEMGEKIPIINLGPIDDVRAKKISLVDNGRYGEDDTQQYAAVLNDIGSAEEILKLLPIDADELASFFSIQDVNFDDLQIPDDPAGEADDPLDLSTPTAPTHQIMRFKVSKVDAPLVSALIDRIKREQAFMESDDLTNSGDALVWIAQNTDLMRSSSDESSSLEDIDDIPLGDGE